MTSSHLLLLLLSFFLPFLQISYAADPTHAITSFPNLPAKLFFFDDTQIAVYHDAIEGNVYISQDEGKTWKRADDIPEGEAQMVIDHPFDNRYAFVLTRGTKHWRTEDRGKTWRSFEMPVKPALVLRPLSFHSDFVDRILYQGQKCTQKGWSSSCHDETYITQQAFGDDPKLLLSDTSRCQFAHSSKDFKHDAHMDLIYCVAFDSNSDSNMGMHHFSSSKLFSSTDFFANKKVEDLGIGKDAKGVVAFAIVSKFAVVALKDMSAGMMNSEMLLYVTVDTKSWAKAQFPHASSAKLRENAYTIVESTIHSLAVDVVLHDRSTIGTLFVSNSNGTFFVQSLKDTNRNEMGFVDYENLYGVEGVGLSNVVANAEEVEGRGAVKQLRTMITFDDGSSWAPMRAPAQDVAGKRISCDPSDINECSLHLHSVTTPHNFGRIFSSPAPGFVMGVGSIGPSLKTYEESDTFLSTDAGVTWTMVRRDAHKYEFGDSGSIIVIVNDEDMTDEVRYSTDLGKTWKFYKLSIKLRARVLLTIPDSTSQKFILLGQVARSDQTNDIGRYVIAFLDFAPTRTRKCEENDFEKWYARSAKSKECLMGHKQWYKRRKADADCYVGEKFTDPVEHEDNCECTDEDFECDFNFVRNGNKCDPVGPEPIPAGTCQTNTEKYTGSSGWRKIPSNTCQGGLQKDKKIEKPCSGAKPAEGTVVHQIHEFPAAVVQYEYFKDSTTILVRLNDFSIWQSRNEGYSWDQIEPGEQFLAFYHHTSASDRAYLITTSRKVFYTVNTGESWKWFEAPTSPNTFHATLLHFHPQSEYLIWVGNVDCPGRSCRAVAHYSRDNGVSWNLIEEYVRNCAWARDAELAIDATQILCESFRDKAGDQSLFGLDNPMQLVGGTDYFRQKRLLFNQVVGFTKFSEFLIVAEVKGQASLDLQVSLNGKTFAPGMFPPSMHPETHAYTVLESSTKSIFLHMTMSERPYWGHILKSNSNGTYFGLSIPNVNRDDRGYVDFEKVIGLDGIAMINVVSNPDDAPISGTKVLQSRITHNDGSTWKPLTPPKLDSHNNEYECKGTKCALHIHSYTERYDPRATFSSPSVVGVLMGVGNVGESLARYTDSDTFLSRDGGFTWEEVHKDAHLWEFGDSGSILVMANDEEPTDHVLFTTDEGLNWREYKFSDQPVRIKSIVTVPSDTSRKFILLGYRPRSQSSVSIHIDFEALTGRKCVLTMENSGSDDFELWSPSEEREEQCLFGRQTLYHRRIRDADCYVGDQKKLEDKVVKNCACTKADFECEFNYERNGDGTCVLVSGLSPRPNDMTDCKKGEKYWYERTPYRKIAVSSCEEGERPDRGEPHECPGFGGHSGFFWFMMFLLPFGFTAMVAYWYYRRSGLARGTIRLPGEGYGPRGGFIDTLASIPWFVIGIAGIAWEKVVSTVESWSGSYSSRRGYRHIPIDEDAQILRFEDEE